MSWSGKCGDCGKAALLDNILGLANIANPAHDSPSGRGREVRERWRRGILRSVTLDEAPSRD